jgi:hypothetical protein
MPGTGAGWDSILYRAYIIGGIVAIVAVVVVTGVLFDPHGIRNITLYSAFAAVSLYMLGILGYWWVKLLFEGYGDPKRMYVESPDDTPEISALRSWSTLSEAMAIHGGDVDELKKLEKAARRPMIEWFGWTSVLVLYVLAFNWLFVLGIISGPRYIYFVAGVVALAIFMLVRTYFLLGGATAAGEYAYLRPLELSVVEAPTMDFKTIAGAVVGAPWGAVAARATVMEGIRHDRPVQIVIDGKQTYTMVKAPTPSFTVESRQGKLVPQKGAPKAVIKSLKSLRKAKRWVDLELQAGPDGIAVERTPGRKQNMWLYDLWLAERLLEALEDD